MRASILRQFRVLALAFWASAFVAHASTPAMAQASGDDNPVLGIWQNPDGTVSVRTEYCGKNLCGVVVSASAKAQADARRAGVDNLVGEHLLQNFVRVDTTAWSGTAFVPDMNTHVAAHLTLIDPDHLKISGCELGGLVCKSQVWTKAK